MSSGTGSFAGDCSFPVWVAGEWAERCFKRSCKAFISRQFTVVTSSFLSKLCGQQLVSGRAVPRRFSAALPRRQPALGITAGSTEMLFKKKKQVLCMFFECSSVLTCPRTSMGCLVAGPSTCRRSQPCSSLPCGWRTAQQSVARAGGRPPCPLHASLLKYSLGSS